MERTAVSTIVPRWSEVCLIENVAPHQLQTENILWRQIVTCKQWIKLTFFIFQSQTWFIFFMSSTVKCFIAQYWCGCVSNKSVGEKEKSRLSNTQTTLTKRYNNKAWHSFELNLSPSRLAEVSGSREPKVGSFKVFQSGAAGHWLTMSRYEIGWKRSRSNWNFKV